MALHIIDQILNKQLEKNIAPLLLAAVPGLLKAGSSLIGSSGRRKEQEAASRKQTAAEFDYKNFDYNQDVGAINNPYAESINKSAEFSQKNIDQSQANQLNQHNQAGVFGATTSLLGASNAASAQANEKITGLRAQGAEYVEGQRQSRIGDRYDQAETFLSRADDRLATANRARDTAKANFVGGITEAAGAAIGGLGAKGASGLKALGGEGAAAAGGVADKFAGIKSLSQDLSGLANTSLATSQIAGGGLKKGLTGSVSVGQHGIQNPNPYDQNQLTAQGY